MTALTKVENINTSLTIVNQVANNRAMAKKLMETKHYQKIGEDGIFAICMAAQANGIDERNALNGEMYYVQGRVGMSAEAMNKYIRMAGHSVSLVKLDDNGCTIRGKRKDTGDIAEITFGVEDMRSAGKNYDKNRKDMFFARALSRLKRILFPDILTKIYEKGECEEMAKADAELIEAETEYVKQLYITDDQASELCHILSECSDAVKEAFPKILKTTFKVSDLDQLKPEKFDEVKQMLIVRRDHHQKELAKNQDVVVEKVNEETSEVANAD
jgi:arsenate reductase-like glutaredoxin family protein